MLPLTRRNRKQIPNRLAIFASLTLLISALAGMHHSSQQEKMNQADFVDQERPSIEQPVAKNVSQSRVSKKKGFKVSLFLFRLD